MAETGSGTARPASIRTSEEDQQDVGTWSPDSGSADCGSLTECDYNDGLGSSFFDDDTGFVGINSFENDLCQDCGFDSIMGFEEDFKGGSDMEIAINKFVAGYVAEVQPVQDKMAIVDDDEDAMQEGDAWSDYLLLQGRGTSSGRSTSPLRKGRPSAEDGCQSAG